MLFVLEMNYCISRNCLPLTLDHQTEPFFLCLCQFAQGVHVGRAVWCVDPVTCCGIDGNAVPATDHARIRDFPIRVAHGNRAGGKRTPNEGAARIIKTQSTSSQPDQP